uniref:PH domain-containing protein n=1 Tax=Amphiprion ocellaris TaxID=80972 RepID=A0AAQ6A7W8_AMPOC
MEGILYKWTNYMTGWQPRWFVLENGVISYYDSEDDVGKGSKGSIKMSVCDIKVHLTDPTRLELIIPGEQHFYLRAVNAAERQRWLVALGSSKAGTLDSHKHKGESEDCLKTKMSELRLYCDLLVQQVQAIQSQHSADTEASLLSATCTTFIRTLEECMTLANQSLTPDLQPPERVTSPSTFFSELSIIQDICLFTFPVNSHIPTCDSAENNHYVHSRLVIWSLKCKKTFSQSPKYSIYCHKGGNKAENIHF